MWVFSHFNPRTREGCDLTIKGTSVRSQLYFNPRTREGCDKLTIFDTQKGAIISIHAPVKGATPEQMPDRMTTDYFNPRTREGCDNIGYVNSVLSYIFQSTHP